MLDITRTRTPHIWNESGATANDNLCAGKVPIKSLIIAKRNYTTLFVSVQETIVLGVGTFGTYIFCVTKNI